MSSSPALSYLDGDATRPIGEAPKVIVHVCNDIGGWGRGFVVAISKRWPEPERSYRAWHAGTGQDTSSFALGEVQFVGVEPELWVANMVAQHDVRPAAGVPPIRYDALRTCLNKVAGFATEHRASVHMPRIGCGLAGGNWEVVGAIISDELLARHVPVFVYDFPAAK